MPTPRAQLSANVVNGKIYLISGRTGGPYFTVQINEVYDPATDSWTTKAPIPTAVWHTAAGATTGMFAPKAIYVIGGLPKGEMEGTNLNQVYNPENDT